MLLLWLTASRGCQAEKKIAQAEKKLETVTSVMKAEMREFNRKRRFKLSTMMLELARAEARNAREVGRHRTRTHTRQVVPTPSFWGSHVALIVSRGACGMAT